MDSISKIIQSFKRCIELKKQADGLSVFNTAKKLELADEAVNISFGVIGGLIDEVQRLKNEVEKLSQVKSEG